MASSSAWAPGPAGAMLTAGANIASTVKAVAATTDAAAGRPNTVITRMAMTTAATATIMEKANITAKVNIMAARRMADRAAVKPTVGRMAAERTVAEHPMVAAERTVAEHLMAAVERTVAERTVVADTLVASTGNQ